MGTIDVPDSSVNSDKLTGNLVTPHTGCNGQELILDADADTSINADTDDQIDVKIAGADDFKFTANNFNILSGSTLTVDSGQPSQIVALQTVLVVELCYKQQQ